MSDKKRYEVVLAEGVDKDDFVAEFSGVVDIPSTLQYVPRCLIIDMTDSQKDVLEADSRVQEVDWIFREERNVKHHGYNEITQTKKPTVDQQSAWNSVDGSEYTSSFICYSAGIDTSSLTASGQTVGMFYDSGLADGDQEDPIAISNATIKQSFDGSTVDIVILEPAGNENNTLMSNNASHPNFLKPSDNSFKIVPMDWSSYDGSVTASENNQVSNTNYVHEHAVASAMAAAGTCTGWAKNSDVRLIYTTNGATAAVNAIVAWHITKPINSATGRRNATIINNSWGYFASGQFNYYIPVDLISQFIWYDSDGNQTTVNRPGGGWANDFTAFHAGGFSLWQIERSDAPGNYFWCVKSGQSSRGSFTLDLAWNNLNTYEGIYSFWSSGNEPNVYRADDSQPQWNNQLFTDAGNIYAISNSQGGFYNEDWTIENRATTSSFYPHRDPYNHETAIVVGGCNNSGLYNTFSESAAHGHLVTTTAEVKRAYNSVSNYGDPQSDVNGYVWSLYGGTSNACPQVVGGAALLVEYFYNKKGAWPTIAELRSLIEEAQDSVDYNTMVEPIFEPTNQPFDWSSAGSATSIMQEVANMVEGNNGLNINNVGDSTGGSAAYKPDRVRYQPTSQSGGPGEDFVFCNTTQAYYATVNKKRFALPWRYRVVPEFVSEPVRTNVYQSRPVSGQTYPRRKIRLG